jgi:hypothetical protein
MPGRLDICNVQVWSLGLSPLSEADGEKQSHNRGSVVETQGTLCFVHRFGPTPGFIRPLWLASTMQLFPTPSILVAGYGAPHPQILHENDQSTRVGLAGPIEPPTGSNFRGSSSDFLRVPACLCHFLQTLDSIKNGWMLHDESSARRHRWLLHDHEAA